MSRDNRASISFNKAQNCFVNLTDAIKSDLTKAFPGVAIESELVKMGIWLQSEKGKNRKGTIAFIMNWLQNATPQKPTINEHLDLIESSTELGGVIRDYLQELWKNKEHILEFNTIRRPISK